VTTKPGQGAKKYIPDLERRLSCCSKNYQKLAQIIPTHFTGEGTITLSLGQLGYLEIRLESLSEYTWALTLRHTPRKWPTWLTGAQMQVRLYHDAKLAEVVSFSGNDAVSEQNSSLDVNMLYPDEKQQLDDFLGEWLDIAFLENK
jgi:uncharacterized protein YqiB (DUF1249 family)